MWRLLSEEVRAQTSLLLKEMRRPANGRFSSEGTASQNATRENTFAKKLIAEWEGTVRRIGWKDWIAKRTLGSDLALTVHWLTRSVNNGSIKAPREGFPKIPGKTGVRVVQ